MIPSVYLATALALGELTPKFEPLSDTPLEITISAENARAMLSTIAGGMITFTGIVVSVAVLVVQFGAGQYTPRLVLRFRRDPAVKHALGMFVAPAMYALVSLRAIDNQGTGDVPNFAVTIAVLLTVIAVIGFFFLTARLTDLLRPRKLFARLAHQCAHAIHDVYPCALGSEQGFDPANLAQTTAVIEHRGPPGVLSAIDTYRLRRLAVKYDCVIEVLWPVGSFLPVRAPLFRVHGDSPPVDETALDRCALLADERTITQDPEFAIRAIVDIAVRALSPAVNDPTTATESLDTLAALLHLMSHRDLGQRRFSDDAGNLRVLCPAADWPEMLDLAVTEIRHYGIHAPQVTRRLRAVLDGLMQIAPPERHDAVRHQLALLDDGLDHAYANESERVFAEIPDHIGLGGFAQPALKIAP